MATLFETAMRGYQMMDDTIKEHRGYKAAKEEFGEGPASAPELFSKLNADRRADEQLDINKQEQDRRDRMDTRQQESHDFSMDTGSTARDEQGMLKMVNGLRQARDSGKDLGEAFDQMAANLPEMGVAEEDIPALRDELLKDPTILDTYHAALRGEPKGGKGSTVGTKGKASKEEIQDALLKFDDTLARIGRLADPAKAAAGKSIFGMPSVGGATKGGFGTYGIMPGSRAADYNADLIMLDGDIRSQAFETLKGGGQITEKESEFAANAIANLGREMSFEKFQEELVALQNYMENLKDAAIRRAGGEVVASPVLDNENYQTPDSVQTITAGHVDPETGAVFTGGPGDDPTNVANWKMPDE